MFPEYWDTRSHSYAPSIVQQTVPRVDPNAALLQELLAAHKRELSYLDTLLTKDELTKVVNEHIDLKKLQRKEGPHSELLEKFNRKDLQGLSKNPYS
ncbi:hypothetical protein LIER_26653 [Lithospermum erythrorhizon]|uniref:Uncharacterized protein n=1 Tax=Lithospermum erythrorhizon TaxID=34254 RepID=A0AAV3RCJ3_LITER